MMVLLEKANGALIKKLLWPVAAGSILCSIAERVRGFVMSRCCDRDKQIPRTQLTGGMKR